MASATMPLLCPTFIGRGVQLDALGSSLDSVTVGHGRTVLVAGEAGIGKTALVRRFADLARARGARIAVGECVESGARRPLGPFAGIVESLERQHLLRERTVRPEAEVGEIDEAARERLYRSFRVLFSELSRARPLVIAVEDLHWADEATLELFPYLARTMRDDRALFIGTYRSDELHRRHPLRQVLAALTRARLSEDLTIPRLDREETAAFLIETLRSGLDPAPAFRAAIEERCEGNPFFIEEVLKALHERGELVYAEGGWRRTRDLPALAIPDSIRDAVRSRFDRLPTRARRTLEIAAVIGQRFELDLLQRVHALDEAQLVDDVGAAIEAQLVVRAEVEHGGCAFRHALTRESVLSELLEPELRSLHAAVGLAIERGSATDERAAELAYHFDAARDRGRAHRYHLAAAESAYRTAAFARAAYHFERAVDLAPRGGESGALYMKLAEAEELAGDVIRAARADEAAWRSFLAAGDTLRAGNSLRRLAWQQLLLGDPRSFDTLGEAIALIEPHGPTPELTWAYALLARHYMRVDPDPVKSREWAERAIALGQEVGYTLAAADARQSLAWAVSAEGDPEHAMALTRQSIDEAVRAGQLSSADRGFNNLSSWYAMFATGDRKALHEEWLRFAERTGLHLSTLRHWTALRALAEGDFNAVLREAAEATGSDAFSRRVQLLDAFVRAARGGPDQSLAKVREILRSFDENVPRYRSHLSWSGVEWFLLAGDDASVLVEAAAMLPAQEGPPGLAVTVGALVAARTLHDSEAWERWSGIALESRASPEVSRFAALWVDADDASRTGDPLRAAALLAEILAVLEAPVVRTLVRLRRVELLLDIDRAKALADLQDVVVFWRKAKATWYLGELERWARERGLRLSEPERSRPRQTLTDREREVARLVSEGLSNREIAERLVVSERTAEGHIQRIMGKLNFRSRSQIAAWFTEARLAPSVRS